MSIIGTGRIGSSFAHQLARAGNQITLVARPGWLSSSATARTTPAARIPGLAARRFCWPGPAQ
jgi:predicted dinucleotide-binding enzyme